MISTKRNPQNHYGEKWAVAAALLNGDKNREEIHDYFRVFFRRFGLFFTTGIIHGEKITIVLEQALSELVECNWAVYNEESATYCLTDAGNEEANRMLKELNTSSGFFNRILRPGMVSKLTFVVHILLSAIKLPAALITGSVSLLNDALDTIIDSFSALLVYLGIRYKKESLSGYIILVFMSLTGLYALWESIHHFIEGNNIHPSSIAWIAIFLSSFFSFVLWILQKAAGIRAGSIAIIAQSVDSRNHLLVAAGVCISFIAFRLGTPLVDLLTGLIISLIILKSSWELFRDIRRSKNHETVDFSAYGFTIFNKFKEKQISQWLLYMVYSGKIENKQQLLYEAEFSVQFEQNNQLEAIGMADSRGFKSQINTICDSLLKNQLILENENSLILSEKGKQQLKALINPKHLQTSSTKNLRYNVSSFLFALYFISVYAAIWLVFKFIPFLQNGLVWPQDRILFTVFSHPVYFLEIPFFILGLILYTKGWLQVRNTNYFLNHFCEGKSGLIVTGPFSRRIHPMYGGWIIAWMAIGFASGSPWVFGLTLLISTGQIVAAFFEERKLRKMFKEEWEAFSDNRRFRFLRPWEMIAVFVLFCVWILVWTGIAGF